LFKQLKLIAFYSSDLSFLLSEDMTSGQDPSNPPAALPVFIPFTCQGLP